MKIRHVNFSKLTRCPFLHKKKGGLSAVSVTNQNTISPITTTKPILSIIFNTDRRCVKKQHEKHKTCVRKETSMDE